MKQLLRVLRGVEEWCEGYLSYVLLMAEYATGVSMNRLFGSGEFRSWAERAQVDTIITVVVTGVVAVVGILIYSEVDSNIDVTGNLASSQTNLTDGFGDAMELVPIVLIVLVAALVIGVISRFRQ